MIYLYLEDIIANSIIELYKKNGTRQISFEVAKIYGEEIIKRLNELGFFAKIKLGSRAEEYFEKEYADYFTVIKTETGKEYYLNSNKTIEEIIIKFRCSLPEEVLPLFENIDIEKIKQNISLNNNSNYYENKSCNTIEKAKTEEVKQRYKIKK